MSVSAFVLKEPGLRLWGLSSRERLRRQVREAGGADWVESFDELPGTGQVLLLDGYYLFDVRTLRNFSKRRNSVLTCPDDGGAAAVIVDAARTHEARASMEGRAETWPEDWDTVTPADFAAFDGDLRRAQMPVLKPIKAENRVRLENQLYGNAYKGITDLVTKFLWPKPARKAVRLAAGVGVTPNMVTTAGLLLVIAACWFFLQGQYLAGLAAGWLMTFLDTVDGKLARVTVKSSKFGHLFDHGIDLLHPPFWYVYWGMSLTELQPFLGLDRVDLNGMIVAGYVAGRIVEALFHALGDCSIFAWRPFDAWFRLVTARRNPCLILLTGSVLVGRPDWGFVAVALWTALTTLVLVVRLLQGLAERIRGGPLQSWLSAEGVATGKHASAYRVFGQTRSAYAAE
jgi:phosphatidylglycerophosphate synthase